MNAKNSISESTRRNIFDALTVQSVRWSGRLEEADFLARLYDVNALPSADNRFRTAEQDIRKHREYNSDWRDDWVFTDPRFDLLRGPDEVLLRFLCEMVNPVVRPDDSETQQIVALVNKYLASDGWEIAPFSDLSGRPLYAPRRLIDGAGFGVKLAKHVAAALDAAYVHRQIFRMEQAIVDDPELAIGTAKEFVETVCKTILAECQVMQEPADDLPQLVKRTLKLLRLTRDDVPDSAKAADTIRVTLSNLAALTKGVAELRNMHGSGHGKHADAAQLSSRHARLAVGAATTLGVFLYETYQEQTPMK